MSIGIRLRGRGRRGVVFVGVYRREVHALDGVPRFHVFGAGRCGKRGRKAVVDAAVAGRNLDGEPVRAVCDLRIAVAIKAQPRDGRDDGAVASLLHYLSAVPALRPSPCSHGKRRSRSVHQLEPGIEPTALGSWAVRAKEIGKRGLFRVWCARRECGGAGGGFVE